jgi:3-methyladenine DNA glycosylase AlkC
MAERLKDIFFTPQSINDLADKVLSVYPQFNRERFLASIYTPEWKNLALKEQMHHTTRALQATLPASYRQALDILRQVAPQIGGFEAMCFPDFVELYGQEDWEASLPALGYFTRFGSAEFAIRSFLHADPLRAMEWMYRWAEDPDPAVRRLASEGCRPRLPWGMALPKFKADPTPVLDVLEKLKNDPDETVRRSVANNLNDISKDHPELALEVCERWFGQTPETDGIVRHALRGLLKAGHPRALRLFGIQDSPLLVVDQLWVTPERLKIGEELRFSYRLQVKGDEPVRVRLEYAVDYVKANGKTSPKVFQHSEKIYPPGVHNLQKKHAFTDFTTRKHYPGEHRLAVIVNGVEKAGVLFLLTES